MGVVLITGPSSKISEIFTGNLLRVLKASSRASFIGDLSDANLLAGVDGHYRVERPLPNSNFIFKALNYLSVQIQIAAHTVKKKDAEVALFFLSESLFIAMLLIKVFRPGMRIVCFPGGYMSEAYRLKGSPLYYPYRLFEKISYTLADRIILYSTNLIGEWDMKKYAPKILIAHEHFLDFDRFGVMAEYGARPKLVGYIGRLSEEKGILEFVQAIPRVLQVHGDLGFLIIGSGQLSGRVRSYLDEQGLGEKVKVIPWVPHDEMPAYLNELRLLVLPSFTEGLPNVMIESLACGTPFLARPVGAIPDVIKDGVTGFIMPDNSPACIAENILRAMDSEGLGPVIENGRRLIREEFSFEAAVERYRSVLSQV